MPPPADGTGPRNAGTSRASTALARESDVSSCAFHGTLLAGAGLRYTEGGIALGAQPGRPGGAGPAGASLGGKIPAGRFAQNARSAAVAPPSRGGRGGIAG